MKKTKTKTEVPMEKGWTLKVWHFFLMSKLLAMGRYYTWFGDAVQKIQRQRMMLLEFVSAQRKAPQLEDQVLELL